MTTLRTLISTAGLLCVFALSTSPRAHAQVYSSSLTGVVTDPSGAAVPGAQATLTDEQKGFTYKAATDTEGRYVLRNLPPGRYRLTVSSQGMRTHNQPGITLNVGENVSANVQFEVQGTTETVMVEAVARCSRHRMRRQASWSIKNSLMTFRSRAATSSTWRSSPPASRRRPADHSA